METAVCYGIILVDKAVYQFVTALIVSTPAEISFYALNNAWRTKTKCRMV